MLFSLSNLLFLIYPVRLLVGTTFDFQTFGKMMLFFMLQMLLMIPLFGIPAALGGSRLLPGQRLLDGGLRRDGLARPGGRTGADRDARRLGVPAVRPQHADARLTGSLRR